jgi:hypothetical protein
MNAPFRPLPPVLEAATQRVKASARTACERTIDSLGLAALGASNVFQRDGLLGAQLDLKQKAAVFGLTFGTALDDRVLRDLRSRIPGGVTSITNWDALSLVDDREVEVQVAAERFGLQVSQGSEWELREMEGYLAPVLAATGAEPGEKPRNPLRPEVIGYAAIRAIESVSDRRDVRKVIENELARSFGATMRDTYTGIIADLRSAGFTPAGLSVRLTRGVARGDGDCAAASHGELPSGAGGLAGGPYGAAAGPRTTSSRQGLYGPQAPADRQSRPGSFDRASRHGGYPDGHGHAPTLGQVDAQMMALMRRLTTGTTSRPGDFAAIDGGAGPYEEITDDGLRLAAPNLIRAHRDELRQAAGGAFEHMVIDVVGTLFDQILSDPKVPPQLARQIGRLQLPVLRAALGDPSFFSSRRHPVRRFINRIASLATAFDDLDEAGGKEFLKLVRELVQGIVDGDFEQVDVYEHKLALLESFVAEQTRREAAEAGDPAALLAQKEGDARVHQHFSRQLEGALLPLATPDFVRDFIARVWSQVIVKATRGDGAKSERVERLRRAGRELFMSVQPKGTPAQRKTFLLALPKLMHDLNEGMDLIGWPESAKKTFFGALLPAHAQSLKGEDALSTLDYNLLARQVDAALDAPLPEAASLPAAAAPAEAEEALVPQFSAEEAARVGLVTEAAVDWNGKVDVDLSADETPVSAVDIAIDGLPAPEAVEPTRGASLVDHVQIGFAYRMHLDGAWQKVRLTHVSPGRSFFVFTRGKRHQRTITLTQRMLAKLCETDRMRAYESAYLIERATARARRQLAALKPGAAAAGPSTKAPTTLH